MRTALVGVLIASVIGVSVSLARPAYHGQMLEQFHLQKSTTSINAGCQYCHARPQGGIGMNPFGIALDRRVPEDAELADIAKALYEQLKARQDSDKDGIDDLLEVVAGTLPGDEKSKPSKSARSLETVLKSVGGVDHFKP
jgi:hypothetical protein